MEKQNTFRLYDILILTSILYKADTLESVINYSIKALNQLEKYSNHERYSVIKISLTYRLSHFLIEAKYLGKEKI